MELAEDYHHTPKYRDIYQLRGQIIERVFADVKEKYAFRYAKMCGLHEFKKLATCKRRKDLLAPLLKKFWKKSVASLHALVPSMQKYTLRFA